LRDPEPLDLDGVRRLLPAGTLLLVYSLGAAASRVYALGPGGNDELLVATIPASEADLGEQVARFRELVARRRSPRLQGGVNALSDRLGRLLLGPVRARLERAGRVLVVPDGALHLLPFAALADPGRQAGRFLVESVPVSRVSSLTLFASLTRSAGEPPAASGGVVGFGDPLYRPPRAGQAAPPSGVRALLRGGGLTPLPWTRGEIQSLEAIAPGTARLYLGSDATEERARALSRDSRFVHFACHGVLDEAFPLESGLALSPPDPPTEAGANGLLQAWEVLEGLRLDAELVTLSACQTGLGGELAGEGLLGLAWAFQYAGARSVVASLWEVSDRSTAELMRGFYRRLGEGLPKAEALRRAQVQLLRRPATSPPWFWAAFTVIGDGR
jgi:CHAT domain-containing protein